jgi:hypothetical protein
MIADYDEPGPIPFPRSNPRPPRFGLIGAIALLLLLLFSARTVAGYVIEYAWWNELGQLGTWYSQLLYGTVPGALAAVIVFGLLWLIHARAMKAGGARLRDHRTYAGLSTLVLLFVSFLVAQMFIDSWTVVRYFGGRDIAAAWRDPVFQEGLPFYFFTLPFYEMALRLVLVVSVLAILLYALTSRLWHLRNVVPDLFQRGEIDLDELRLHEVFQAPFLRAAGVVFLLTLAARFYLDRYEFLLADHGFLVGVDYVNETISLPLNWLTVAACVAAAGLAAAARWRFALIAVAGSIVLLQIVPRAVNWAYVRPNEISIQRPYIERHIAATRAAFDLSQHAKEIDFPATMSGRFDPAQHKATLDNVRLWDWRAFHDTVTQIQALRPYYVFPDTDVDRYLVREKDGTTQIRQVMLSPRELDVRQLPDARTRWINPHFIYTHGYGVVLAEANRITADGLPELYIKNAPPEISSPTFKITRPEIYYGETVHEPVFVRTEQPEFNYPKGSENVHSKYDGKGGFLINSPLMRLAAALREGDWNIVLTGQYTNESRMMIRRKVIERVDTLAPFLFWETDPYLVITEGGRLVWMIDGFTTSDAHPYSRSIRMAGVGSVNYMRNSVKATVDAYDGSVRMFVFEPDDPIIRSYQKLFPNLFQPESAMPADLRAHARYPERQFRAQAEVYRTFHMRDPEAFYNKEDVWDVAQTITQQEGATGTAAPTYIVATLPGEKEPEFLLLLPFTPRNKPNLIGVMIARCDGRKLGELMFLQLSKQELVFGPMQIKARINQDQSISKDLTLWNQQGSQVLRGQMLVLPIESTFLYVEPIYLQAAQAPMPQLKKVAMAMGNSIAYADTYEQALAQLMGQVPPRVAALETRASTPGAPPPDRMGVIRGHLKRYRELLDQARKELEAAEAAAK